MENKIQKTDYKVPSKVLNEILQTEISDLPTLWKSIDELPSISRIKNEYGEVITKTILIEKIHYMLAGLPTAIDDIALKKLVTYILTKHINLKVAELDIIGVKLMEKTVYGKISLNDVVQVINEYWEERLNYAEEEQIKNASKYKGEPIKDIEKAYEQYFKNINKETEKNNEKEKIAKKVRLNYKPVVSVMDNLIELNSRFYISKRGEKKKAISFTEKGKILYYAPKDDYLKSFE